MGRKVRRRAEVEERGRRAKSEGGEEKGIFIIDHESCSLKGFILYVHQQHHHHSYLQSNAKYH